MSLMLATLTALFTVVNPLGAMPVFVALTKDADKRFQSQQAKMAAIYMTGILITFFFAGTYILNFFGISLEGLRIAGGLVIIKSGFDLLNANFEKNRGIDKKVKKEAAEKADISFSPLAMPMLSGPGSIALLIGLSTKIENNWDYGFISGAVILMGTVTFLLLKFSPLLVKALGHSGLNALSRMMGFIVLALGIQFIAAGASPILQNIFASSE